MVPSSLTPSLGLIIFPGDERQLSRTVQKWCTLSQRNVSVRKDKTRSSVPFTPVFMDRKVVFLSFFISSKLFCGHLIWESSALTSSCNPPSLRRHIIDLHPAISLPRERNGSIAFWYLLRECAMWWKTMTQSRTPHRRTLQSSSPASPLPTSCPWPSYEARS